MDLEQLKRGRYVPGDSGASMERVPDWMDRDRFRRGRLFFLEHCGAISVGFHLALAAGFTVNSVLTPLIFTGKSNTPAKALTRYLRTWRHIVLWHVGDVWDAPHGAAHLSIRQVRDGHRRVGERMRQGKKPEDGTMYVSQYDMALVQGGFIYCTLLYADQLGIHCHQEDLDDYVFFWRGIGYLLGIEDRYNLCTGGYHSACQLLRQLETEMLFPAMAKPPPGCQAMQDAYLEAMNQFTVIPVNSWPALYAWLCESVGVEPPQLSLGDRLRLGTFRALAGLLWVSPVAEYLYNGLCFLTYSKLQAESEERKPH